MAPPQMARTTCSHCNAWYNSERELLHHMQMAHRKFGLEQSLPPSSVHANTAKQGCTTSLLTEQENEMGQSCGRTPAEQQEEPTQADKGKAVGA
jgi:hypothetical protein